MEGFNLLRYNANQEEVVKNVYPTKRFNHLILLTINEWKINTYANLALYYNIDLKIFDRVGNVLAESNVKGADNLGGSFNISKYAKIVAPQAFKKKIEELLNNPDVVKALQ